MSAYPGSSPGEASIGPRGERASLSSLTQRRDFARTRGNDRAVRDLGLTLPSLTTGPEVSISTDRWSALGPKADVGSATAYAADCLPRLVLLGSSENSLLRETIAVIFPAAKIIFPASGGSCEGSVVVSRRWSASGCDAIHPPPGRSRSVEATVAIPAANRQHEGV